MTVAWPGAFLKRTDVQLFLTSFLGLYAELLCIRWMPAHVRFLSYFTNFILLASFLGLGVGILSVRRKLPLGPRTFPLLFLFAAILIAATKFELKIGSAGVLYYGAGESGVAPPENALVLPAAFLLISLLFVCIGRPLGILLGQVTPPLRAYGLDIGGSLAGIAAFFVLSLFEQPPVVWFAGLVVICLLLAGPTWLDRAYMVVPLLIAGTIAWSIGQSYWWSPYYKIGLTQSDNGHGWELNVNESGHQSMMPSNEKEPFYRSPYEIFGSGQFQHALIIGAGSGSDTAIGLNIGNVGHIDAVEIDPVIARLGRQFHPEQPFSDPRVDVHVDDGRSFIRKSTDKYDLIIFALPDSLTLTSQFSSLRLESFLFTEESFREARDHLTPDGAIVLYNYYREDWLLRKLAGMLETSFGQPPYVQSFGGWGRAGVLVDGPRLQTLLAQRPDLNTPYKEVRSPTPELNEDPNAILLPLVGQGVLAKGNPAGDADPTQPTPATDEWPLMYLRAPGLALPYIFGLAMVAVIAIGLIFTLAPAGARRGFSGHMFFLGAAFMLLETRSLVTFSLLFGSTWLVNSLVFFAILCSVMLAVFISSRFEVRPSALLYGLLIASLLVAYLVPQAAFLSIDFLPLRYALASLVAFLPVFLANLVFAGSFKETGLRADVAFASNLIGIMLGGMLEYASLLIGYRQLLVIVIGFYLVSALLMRRRDAAAGHRDGGARSGSRHLMVLHAQPDRDAQASAAAGRDVVGTLPEGEASFPLAERPRLRAIEIIPVQDTGAGRGVWLRDPADPALRPLSISAAGVEVLMLLDGRRTIGELAAGLALRGVSISEQQVRTFLARLDECGFLEGPRYEHRFASRKAAFLAQPLRRAIHAGGAYPAGVAELPRTLAAGYLHPDGPGALPAQHGPEAPSLRSVIAPHVDLHRGAPTYSWAYKALAESQPAELYVVLGTCHTPVEGHFAATRKAYDTPLGAMPADQSFLESLGKLYRRDLFEGEFSHAGEHSIEFQAVYLRSLGVVAPIVPLLCDSLHSMTQAGKSPRSVHLVRDFIDALREAMAQDGRRITLIAAVDLAHIGPRFGDRWLVDAGHRSSVERGDREMLGYVLEPDAEAYYAQVMQDRDARRICGLTPIYILTALMESEQRRGELLRYTQWVDTDGSSSVTFVSAIFR